MTSRDVSGDATFRDYLSLFALAMIWSSSFMAIKVAVETVPPVTMTAARMIIGAGLLLGVLLIKKERLPAVRSFWGPCFVLGLVGNGLPFTLIAWGEVRVDSGLAAILMAVMPLATVLLAHFFSAGERLTTQRAVGIAIGFSGVIILVGPEAVKGLGGDVWHQLSVSGGAICYAIAAVYTRRLPPAPLLPRAVGVTICAALQMVPLALIADWPWQAVPTGWSLVSVVYLGLVPTAIATLIYFDLIAARGAGFFAFINYLIPVMGVIWGMAVLGEELHPAGMAALATILMGLFVANWRRRGPKAGGEDRA